MYENYYEMLLNPEIDAVIISTPDQWHAQQAIEAALAKKDIYLQKPATVLLLIVLTGSNNYHGSGS